MKAIVLLFAAFSISAFGQDVAQLEKHFVVVSIQGAGAATPTPVTGIIIAPGEIIIGELDEAAKNGDVTFTVDGRAAKRAIVLVDGLTFLSVPGVGKKLHAMEEDRHAGLGPRPATYIGYDKSGQLMSRLGEVTIQPDGKRRPDKFDQVGIGWGIFGKDGGLLGVVASNMNKTPIPDKPGHFIVSLRVPAGSVALTLAARADKTLLAKR